jgi:NAD(P)-dependent dehydrogenase (short-subunit alcohol dehydrogenase family)
MRRHFQRSAFTRRDLLAGAAIGATSAITPALVAATENDHPTTSIAPHLCASTNAPLRELTGKVAFITGGSSGIGLGIAQACLQAKMKVVITYRSKEHLETALKTLRADRNPVQAVEVDVTDVPALQKAAEHCVGVFGKVHLLVNNAGVQNPSPLTSISRKQWDQLMNVNVGGVLNCVQTFLPYLTRHEDGAHIVSTSSILGLFTIGGGYAAYCASKFAVVSMMESLRAELAKSRVGVSVLCPGVVKSNLEKGLANLPAASDPIDVGLKLIEGIRRNKLYILTHPEFEPIIRNRSQLIERSIEPASQVPDIRQQLVNSFIAGTIYSEELARGNC